MVSNLFSIRFADSPSPAAEVVVTGRDAPVREYLAGPENALLGHVIASDGNTDTSPILLFGPIGVGKSHLLRGMVDRYEQSQPQAHVRLLNTTDFCREISHAHEVDSLDDVRRRLRELDYLALDDLHALADKPYAQLELLRLLDTLQDRQARIVMTSRLSPNSLPFKPALTSRLSAGLTVPIQSPGQTTRAAFAHQFAQELGIDLPDEAVEHIAEVNPASIPEIRGIVLQIQQMLVEDDRPIDTELVSHAIQQRADTDVPSVREIIKKVARYFGLTVAELTGPSRRQTTVLARNTAIYLTRNLRKDSFEQIGSYFGGRDHSTVMHAFQKITKKRDDSLVNSAIGELLKRLGVQHHNF